jgi:hypothetical protein
MHYYHYLSSAVQDEGNGRLTIRQPFRISKMICRLSDIEKREKLGSSFQTSKNTAEEVVGDVAPQMVLTPFSENIRYTI